ncbi:forkhead box protein E1-like [Rhopilema esculentum]|uniref:forkhead box protein E1-like n=1 Tax=Rhopilema esculentum TaxID=499914 RepID=UPI0031E1AD9A|eukprot:gene2965-1217_t
MESSISQMRFFTNACVSESLERDSSAQFFGEDTNGTSTKGDWAKKGHSKSCPYPSYIEMIATVLLSERPASKTLQEIYKHLEKRYPFLEQRGRSWKNSVRHTLSLNECFIKVPRQDSGKCCDWTVNQSYLNRFSVGDFRRQKRRPRTLALSHTNSCCRYRYPQFINDCHQWNSNIQLPNNMMPDMQQMGLSQQYMFSDIQLARNQAERLLNSDHEPYSISCGGQQSAEQSFYRLRHYPASNNIETNTDKTDFSIVDDWLFKGSVDFSKLLTDIMF